MLDVSRPATLSELESVIERGKQTFIEVGLALMEVRDRRLYKDAGFSTFEKYCIERWGWGARRGRQLIDAAQTAGMLADQVDNKNRTTVPLSTESQARELAPLVKSDPEQAREVWRDVTEEAEETGQSVTAVKVREAVQRVTSQPFNDGWDDPEIERVEGEVIPDKDPRIDELKHIIRDVERCQRIRDDVFAVAFRNAASDLRKVLREMERANR